VRGAAPALPHAIRLLGVRPGNRVLVPALHHGPEVDALRRAGLECLFYGIDRDGAPVTAELEHRLGTGVRALYLIHHLGLAQDGERWRLWCRDRNLLLFEDCLHAWLAHHDGRPVGSSGELAIFSPPAMLPLPEGDAMIVRPPGDADGWSGEAAPVDAPGWRLRFLLPRLSDEEIAALRRANYRLLLSELEDTVAAPFARLPDGASPYVFPVTSDRPQALLERLERAGVGAIGLWRDDAGGTRGDRGPRAVGLPVHQELRDPDLERVVAAVRGARRPASARLELVEDLDALGTEWDEIACASGNLFASREWLGAWSRHFRPREPLFVACRTAGGRLAAILPLELTTVQGVRVLRFLGHGPSDQLGPICDPADATTAARLLRRVLLHPPVRFQLFLGRHLPGPQDWASLLGAARVREDASPVVRFGAATWEEVLASLSTGLRKEIRYDARRLAREHEVRHRRADDPAALQADLDVLFRLHTAQWGERSSFVRHEAFQRDFAAIALDRGWLRLWILEVDGRPVAAKHNFRFSGSEFSYQGGRDPGWKGPSVGLVNLSHAMHDAFEEGAREYRFLRGAERYKFRFPVSDAGLQTVARGQGALGRAALAAGLALDEAPALRAARGLVARRALG